MVVQIALRQPVTLAAKAVSCSFSSPSLWANTWDVSTCPRCLGNELCSYISVYFKAYPICSPFSSPWSGMRLLLESIHLARQLCFDWRPSMHHECPCGVGMPCPVPAAAACVCEHLYAARFQGFTISALKVEQWMREGLGFVQFTHSSHLFPSVPWLSLCPFHLFPELHLYGERVHCSPSSREAKWEQLSSKGKSAHPEKVSLFLLHTNVFPPRSIFRGGTAVARGPMTPFCLIINSRGRLVPYIAASAARR